MASGRPAPIICSVSPNGFPTPQPSCWNATTAAVSRCSTSPMRSPRRRDRHPQDVARRAERAVSGPARLLPRSGAGGREICERVLAARERGMLLREQAVLARAGHDTDLLELELSRRRIPFVKYGGLRYLRAAHVKDFLALLRLTDRVTDEMSWFRVLMLLEGVGPARARRCLDKLLAGGLLSLTQLPHVGPGPGCSCRRRRRSRAMPSPRRSRAGPDAERLRDALAPVVPRSLRGWGGAHPGSRRPVRPRARGRTICGHSWPSCCSIRRSRLADLAGPAVEDEDWLVLSTVHSAKGLEWQAVHVVAAYDGNFPSDLAAGSREALAEERRLLYVALTRARRSLTVYVPRRYYHRGDRSDSHGYGKASRFFSAAAQGCCDVVHLADDARRPAQRSRSARPADRGLGRPPVHLSGRSTGGGRRSASPGGRRTLGERPRYGSSGALLRPQIPRGA